MLLESLNIPLTLFYVDGNNKYIMLKKKKKKKRMTEKKMLSFGYRIIG